MQVSSGRGRNKQLGVARNRHAAPVQVQRLAASNSQRWSVSLQITCAGRGTIPNRSAKTLNFRTWSDSMTVTRLSLDSGRKSLALTETANFADTSRPGWGTSGWCPSRASSATWTSGFAATSGCASGSSGRRAARGSPTLMKLGIAEHEAYTHGMSSKGPWVLSSSQAVHQALSTALLEEWGLPSLLAIWTKLTAKSRIA